MDAQKLLGALKSSAVDVFSEDELLGLLECGRPLRIKLGADPSRPDLHLGHTVVLRKLKLLQDAGHEIVFIIGDFTGMIGDPSGRSKTRVPLTFEQTRENGQSYFDQVTKILNPEKTRIEYNSSWLSQLTFSDVLALAGKYTLARMLERDDFKKRFAGSQPIGLHEFFYPLMQGYDSVALDADIEIGGTDQTFNLLVGRELQRDYGQTPQVVMTFPLLPGLDGVQKMSKSLSNYIGIDEAPGEMYEKCMKVPDALLNDYFRLTTEVPEHMYKNLDARGAHFLYADTITAMYHSREAAEAAKVRYLSVASGGAPDNMPVIEAAPGGIPIIELLRLAGFAASNSEARRLIQGRGVSFDDDTIQSIDEVIAREGVLKKGKNKFVRVTISRS